MHYSLKLAKRAVETYIRKGKIISPPGDLPKELMQRKGVFVTIKKGGRLRGCMGTYWPTRKNTASEIIHNAVAACSKDYRFSPVTKQEVPFLSYQVYLLDKPEKVDSFSQLDPQKYGILVKKGLRSGLLLPGLEGIDSVDKQLELACKKAGVQGGYEDMEVYRFKAQKYEE